MQAMAVERSATDHCLECFVVVVSSHALDSRIECSIKLLIIARSMSESSRSFPIAYDPTSARLAIELHSSAHLVIAFKSSSTFLALFIFYITLSSYDGNIAERCWSCMKRLVRMLNLVDKNHEIADSSSKRE